MEPSPARNLKSESGRVFLFLGFSHQPGQGVPTYPTLATAAVRSSLQSASGPDAMRGRIISGAWGSRDMVPDLVTGTIENVHFCKVL